MKPSNCPRCRVGKIIVLNTKIVGPRRVQYVGCRRCGFRPDENKRVLLVAQT